MSNEHSDNLYSFINFFEFHFDKSKPGISISAAKVGEIYVTKIILEPAAVIGNIYYKINRVVYYVLSGEIKAIFEQINTGEREEVIINSNNKIVHVPEYVAMAAQNIGKRPTVLLAFSNLPLISKDNYEYKLI